MADPTPEELQDQIDELKSQLAQLKGRLAVLEYVDIQAVKKIQPPAFSKWKQEIETKKEEDFTDGKSGNPATIAEYQKGAIIQLNRLRNLVQ